MSPHHASPERSARKALVRSDFAQLPTLLWPVVLSRLGIIAMMKTSVDFVLRHNPSGAEVARVAAAP